MTYSARRHDLPSALVAPDSPLTADVMGRTIEALDYVWQVTTGTADGEGGALPGPEGHTHDSKNDQTLTADSQFILGYAFGFGSPRLIPESAASPLPGTPHLDPNGGWANAGVTGALVSIRGQVEVPFDAAGLNVSFMVFVLIEKGTALSAPTAVTVTVTVGGAVLTGSSAVAAVGLEMVAVGPFAPAAFAAGTNELTVDIATALSSDYARLWHAMAVT